MLIFCPACSIYRIASKDVSTNFHRQLKMEDVVYIERLDKPHEIIGYITVNTERRQSLSDVMDKMKREAAILGGNTITDIKSDATGTWKSLPAQNLVGNAYVRANFSATVVILKK